MLSDDYWYVDLVRLWVGITSIWLAVLVLRLAAARGITAKDAPRPPVSHLALYASYALALVLLCALRISHLGDRPTWDLWWAVVVDLLGIWGAASIFRFHRPWPRRRRRQRGGPR